MTKRRRRDGDGWILFGMRGECRCRESHEIKQLAGRGRVYDISPWAQAGRVQTQVGMAGFWVDVELYIAVPACVKVGEL